MFNFNILVVDHDPVMRKDMYESLKNFFYVRSAKKGEECLALMKEEQPALVLIDFLLDDMSSFQLQEAIKKQYPDVYVAFISNIDRSKVGIESMRRRAMDYVYRGEDMGRFVEDTCKLVRHIVDTNKMDKKFIESDFYAFAKGLFYENKIDLENLKQLVSENSKNGHKNRG